MRFEILNIETKGRKYYQTSGSKQGYLIINDISKNFKIGDRVIVQLKNLTTKSKYGIRYIYEPKMDLTQMTYEQTIEIIKTDKHAYCAFSDDCLRKATEYNDLHQKSNDEKELLDSLIVDNQETLQALIF